MEKEPVRQALTRNTGMICEISSMNFRMTLPENGAGEIWDILRFVM